MVKAIGYVRQSTLKQQSLATQKSLIIEIAKQYGWYNVTFYDDMRSGRNTKRSGYQNMVEMITSGKCKVFRCFSIGQLIFLSILKNSTFKFTRIVCICHGLR